MLKPGSRHNNNNLASVAFCVVCSWWLFQKSTQFWYIFFEINRSLNSVQKHYMMSEFRTSFRDMCDTAGQNSVHHDLKPSRIEKDEGSIQAIVDLLANNWANPFDNRNTELVSLSSGAVPPESICNDLSNAQEIGEHAFQMFVTERLERNPPSRKFTDPIRKQKLKTFSSMTKTKKTVTVSGKETILRANCNLFGTMVLASQSRDLNIKEVLSHPLGPIPWAPRMGPSNSWWAEKNNQ